MAKKIALAFDISGTTITDGNGATIRITFHDQHKGVRELDTIDEEAEKLGGRRVEARLSSADETGITASGLCAERLPLLDLEARRAVRRFRAAASSFASAPIDRAGVAELLIESRRRSSYRIAHLSGRMRTGC